MTKSAIALGFWLDTIRVGTLVHTPDQRITCALDPDYEADPARPVLSLSLKTAGGGLVAPRPSSVVLPPWFANLLPEGHLREYIARMAGVTSVREFFLLAQLGEDLPGAVIVRPDGALPVDATPDERGTLAPAPGAIRFSLAGVQLKFSAINAAHGGLTIPASGAGGDWIVKLPSTRWPGLARHERVMLDLADAVGITVPERRLLPLDAIEGLPSNLGSLADETALAVRRFDRASASAGRVHMEDFAQVFNLRPREKYDRAASEHIAKVLRAETPEDDVAECIRRLAFTVLIGNADAHLKNWSLIYPDGRRPRLAPAYDLVGVVALNGDGHLGLSLGGEQEMRRITMPTFARFAHTVGLPERWVIDLVLETRDRFRRLWHEHPAVGELSADERTRLAAHQAGLHLLR